MMTDEQETTQETQPEATTENTDNRGKTQTQEPSLIEKAEKIRDDMASSEKRVFEKIAEFEKKLAEQILSGRAELVPTKSQEEKDKEEAEKTVKRFLG